jgi:hypothetical protein
VATRYDVVRLQNQRIASSAHRHHFGGVARVPFLCECEDDGCRALISLPLTDFDELRQEALFVIASGHRLPEGTCVSTGDGFEFYRVSTGRSHR